MRKPAVIAYLVAAFTMVADQASKYWALNIIDLPARQHIDLSPIFDLTMVWNRGVSFGLFASPEGHELVRWLLTAFQVAMAIVLAIWARKQTRIWSAIGIGMIIGGAVGNVIDRVRFGAVADFIDVSGLGFFPWVFNVADAGINVGVAILLLETFLTSEKGKTAAS